MREKKDREKIYIQAEEKTDRPIFRPIFEEREIKKVNILMTLTFYK